MNPSPHARIRNEYVFRAKSEEERNAWTDEIDAVRKELCDTVGKDDPMEMDDPYDPFPLTRFAPPEACKKYTMKDFETLKMVGKGTFGKVLLVYRKDDPTETRMAMKQISKELIRQKVSVFITT